IDLAARRKGAGVCLGYSEPAWIRAGRITGLPGGVGYPAPVFEPAAIIQPGHLATYVVVAISLERGDDVQAVTHGQTCSHHCFPVVAVLIAGLPALDAGLEPGVAGIHDEVGHT